MAVTSIEELKAKSTQEVEIGIEGEYITLRLKRLSMMGLASVGKIPNALMGTAVGLFEGKTPSKQTKTNADGDKKDLKAMTELIDLVCTNAMVEPTFEDAGEYLDDNQKMEIFYWAQGGVVELQKFRAEQKHS